MPIDTLIAMREAVPATRDSMIAINVQQKDFYEQKTVTTSVGNEALRVAGSIYSGNCGDSAKN